MSAEEIRTGGRELIKGNSAPIKIGEIKKTRSEEMSIFLVLTC